MNEPQKTLHWLETHPHYRPDVTVRAYVTNLPSKLNLHGPLEARVDFHLIKS